jgi:hypothetical protein
MASLLSFLRVYIAMLFNLLGVFSLKQVYASLQPEPHRKDSDVFEGPCQLVTVLLPDMFSSFLSIPPTVNPLYEEVKAESEIWFSELVSSSVVQSFPRLTKSRQLSEAPKMCKKIMKLDFAWFCSVTAPNANKDDLRVLCDWGNWVSLSSLCYSFHEIARKLRYHLPNGR